MSFLKSLKNIFTQHEDTKEQITYIGNITNNDTVIETEHEPNNLEDLAKSGKTFWKFTQSHPGMSHENLYSDYEEGKITVADDPVNWLSFTTSDRIGTCVGYGDRLTKLCFDLSNPLFNSIKDTEIIDRGNMFGEIISRKLLVEKNYSLEDPKTVCMIIKMSKEKSVRDMFSGFSPVSEVLEKYKFDKSLDFCRYIEERTDFAYFDQITDLKDNIDKIYENWKINYEKQNPLNILDQIIERDENTISKKKDLNLER